MANQKNETKNAIHDNILRIQDVCKDCLEKISQDPADVLAILSRNNTEIEKYCNRNKELLLEHAKDYKGPLDELNDIITPIAEK